MAQIPDIKFTRQEIERIYRHKYVNFGSESRICRSAKPNTAYKIYFYGIDLSPNEKLLENKKKKLVTIYNMGNLKNSIQMLSTISCKGKLVGYEMSYNKKDKTLSNIYLTIEEKLSCLQQVRKVLEYYESQGIIYGDIKPDNILVNLQTKSIKFCDIDNIKIGQYSMDNMPRALCEYIEHGGILDNKVHAYMHNLLTLEQLSYSNVSSTEILNNISNDRISQYITKQGREIIKSMLEPASFTGEYVIEYIKK